MNKMKNNDSIEKLSDAELSKKLGKYQLTEAVLSLITVLTVVSGIIILFAMRNTAVAGILIFTGVALGVFAVGNVQKYKKNLILRQMGDFFSAELIKNFGAYKELPQMLIDKKFFQTSEIIGNCFNGCSVRNYYCGEHRRICFSAANAEITRIHEERINSEDWMTRTVTVFNGIVIRCKTDADAAVALTVNERDGEHGGADIADSAVFDARFDVRSANKYDIPAFITATFREMIKEIEITVGGKVQGAVLQDGIFGVAISSKYLFADIPQNFDARDINGMRKYYLSSLSKMVKILDIIQKNSALFGAEKE